MTYLNNKGFSKSVYTVLKHHITAHGKFYRLENLSCCHTNVPPNKSHKSDLIGPPHPLSNLRPVHIHVTENEAPIERRFRLKRQEVQQWNQDFWTKHNTRFVKPKLTKGPETTITISRLVKKNSAMSSRSAPETFNTNDKNKLREESFQNWLASKKQQQIEKREDEKRVKRMVAEQEQIKKETAELSYLLWKHKKDQQKKAKELKERQEMEEGERKKKLKQHVSRERVNQWMSSSKLKPRPVPSNLGLLSLTATNPPSFFNPHPWVDPV